jgi:hypothetical protein
LGEDRAADARVGAQLGTLVAAFGANDADVIRREAEAVVQVVTDVMDQRKKLQQEQMQLLSESERNQQEGEKDFLFERAHA